MERRFVPKGTLVMKQGDRGNCAYLVQSGSVIVFTENNGKRVELGKLELGQIFGEMSLIFNEPRSASVQAYEDSNLIVITRETFEEKLTKTDPTLRAVMAMLTERITNVNNSLAHKKSNIKDMEESARLIYQNILGALPEADRRDFQNEVLPKLEDFIAATSKFHSKVTIEK